MLQGIAPASAIFQKKIEQVIQGVDRTVAWIDNIIITGKTMKDHVKNIEEVLKRLQDNGMKARASKCQFFKLKSIRF